ncbi:hypothetical protein OJF2_71620 [Aquisphaera giovannonii]|uniref:Glycosyl transferase family 11 n=1 Tax=Aquisphaera giovannonii TaxID=406548 RepID=A0A5B9WEA2_9BACT|nr:hypothetical protein [Aquisphaera giovannonii]QEH38559.1 hypothetical protein OJF2_71620 [Aquisphaera giovannonii]
MSAIVSISCLGSYGRFGNQLFQYAVARKYAELHGARLETPAWIGQRLFGIDDPPLSRTLPRAAFDELPWGRVDVDLFGFFQYQDAVGRLSTAELRRWYAFRPEWTSLFEPPRPYYIAANLRRGDYLDLQEVFAIVTKPSYLDACRRFGLDVDALIWVCEELRPPMPAFDGPGLGFLADFFAVMNADVVLRANSTFSWWAALLGEGRVFSPVVEDRTGYQTVEFVEGNWPRICDPRNCRTLVTDLHVAD